MQEKKAKKKKAKRELTGEHGGGIDLFIICDLFFIVNYLFDVLLLVISYLSFIVYLLGDGYQGDQSEAEEEAGLIFLRFYFSSLCLINFAWAHTWLS